MKKKILFYTMLAIIIATNAEATVWRVNNNPGVSADFNNLQTAVNSASVQASDTLYVEGSYNSYGAIIVNKKLVFIGSGYFLSENDSTQANKLGTSISSIKFNLGSNGSKLYGFKISGGDGIDIYDNNITLSGNYMSSLGTGSVAIIILKTDNLSNIIIEKNYISFSGFPQNAVLSYRNELNLIIRNNYFKGSHSQGAYMINLSGYSSNSLIFISNNIFAGDGKVATNNSFFYNNIMITGTLTGNGNAYYFNMGNSTQFGNQNGNKQNVNMSTVFVNYSSYVDNGLLLKPGSPAIGAGFGGVDCGIFGGENPYVLSGLPPIPSIFEVNQAGIGSPNTPIQVNLKAKSNR